MHEYPLQLRDQYLEALPAPLDLVERRRQPQKLPEQLDVRTKHGGCSPGLAILQAHPKALRRPAHQLLGSAPATFASDHLRG